MEIVYTKRAAKDLENLPKDIQRRLATKMRFYAAQPDPLQFAERLTDPELGDYRFRVGDWRIVFDILGKEIVVLKIKKRDKVYK